MRLRNSATSSAAFVQLAEFFLDGFELLAQEVLALGLVHLALGLGLDLLLHGQDFDFLGENLADLPQALQWVLDLQDRLRDFDLERRDLRRPCRRAGPGLPDFQ